MISMREGIAAFEINVKAGIPRRYASRDDKAHGKTKNTGEDAYATQAMHTDSVLVRTKPPYRVTFTL